MPPARFDPSPKAGLNHVRNVIEKTDVPSWIESPPKQWGAAAAGTPKADHWRRMATIYFPIALITCWGGPGNSDVDKSRCRLLDLTMCIVIATLVACKHKTSERYAHQYLRYMCTYLRHLPEVIEAPNIRPNNHMALHIYDFLQLWGSIYCWWCFPFERINGLLQRISVNSKAGKHLTNTSR